jgi:hypothetical protein
VSHSRASLVACALLSCADASPAANVTLAIVTGEPPGDAAARCELAEWTAPWGNTYRVCMNASSAIEIARSDIYAIRIEDRKFGDRSWYLVTARLANGRDTRIWEKLQPPPVSIPAGASWSETQKLLPDAKPYAVLADGELSVVLPGISILEHRSLMAAFEDLASAEAFASARGVPVERVISQEIASLPSHEVSMVQLIAEPERWTGKRVSVQGYLSSLPHILLAREQEDVLHEETVTAQYTSKEEVEAASACTSHRVEVDAFADRDRGGSPELIRIERLEAVPNGPRCLPLEPPSRPAD